MNNAEFVIGKLKEEDFAKLFTSTSPSTENEDIYEHWDLKVGVKIDVKSLKKQSREDIMHNENFHWVELMNVRGERSWTYGDADFFAFETNDYWIIIEKMALQKFIEGKCKGKEIGSSKNPYELYRRTGRKDIVVKVKTIDLIFISTKMINKNETDNQK
jgi:hypothetical protein